MNRRRISFGVAIILFFALCIFVIVDRQGDSTGRCASLADLPWFGANLPRQDLGNIEYIAERKHRRVLAKVAATSIVFDEIAAKMNLSVIRYTQGFSDVDLAAVMKEFRPTGTNVWCAWGKLSKDGRATILLYFEPAQKNETLGTLYIHVS